MSEKNLFNYDYVKPVKIPVTFASLNLHQKINYKANCCGFQRIVYLSKFNYFRKELHKPITDRLTSGYWWHYRANSGGGNQIDNYIKETNSKLF